MVATTGHFQPLDTAENDTPVTVFGSGKPLRQFIYSQDLAKLMMYVNQPVLLIRENPKFETLIVSPAPA